MTPPIFTVCSGVPAVQAVLGTAPVRLFPFGQAPEGVPTPYAVWRLVGGSPENYLGDRPDADACSVQVDVYAERAADATAGALALRDAIEPRAYVAAWLGDSRDPVTQRYRCTFRVDWIVPR